MIKKKLVTVTSVGPLPEAGGIYGPIPPTRLAIDVIGKMVTRGRSIYECDPKAPTDEKRWIPLTISNYNKEDNFPKENYGRGVTAKVAFVDESPLPNIDAKVSVEVEEKKEEETNMNKGEIAGSYQYESDSSTRKTYMVEDSLNLNDEVKSLDKNEENGVSVSEEETAVATNEDAVGEETKKVDESASKDYNRNSNSKHKNKKRR